jgi:hypothetical protein
MRSLACLLLVASLPPAPATSADHLPIADRGLLRFALPPSWKEVGRKTPAHLPPTFSFQRSGPVRAALELTVLWSPRGDPKFTSQDNVRKMAVAGQASFKGGTVEDQLPLKELKGAAGPGFVYAATDKNPKGGSGDFPVLTHGELAVGNLVLSFSAFTDSKDNVAVQEAIGALQRATFVSDASQGATSLEGNGVRVTLALDGFKKDLGYQSFGRTYARLGQFTLDPAVGDSDGPSLIVSVLVDDARAGSDLRALKAHVLRGHEADSPQVSPIETPAGFTFMYQRSVLDNRATNWNLYFETLHGGKWVELHFSSTFGPAFVEVESLRRRALTVVRSVRTSTVAR